MESQEENDPLHIFIGQSIGTEPLLPSPTEDAPEHWTQLLNFADQPEVSGLPLPTLVEDENLKCENCSLQFCSTVNYRRHIRTHRSSLKKSSNVDKEFQKKKDSLAAYWDQLTLEEVKVIVSVNDGMLKETRGASIVEALTSSLHKIGVVYPLPSGYTRAGTFLLDFILAQPLSLPISSSILFGVLDDASEKTFLCGGPPESLKNYVFDGVTGQNILDLKNAVASTSFLVEDKLVRAWVDAQNAESLRCQTLLEEEEKADNKQKADALEKKKQKRLRQKEKKKDSVNKVDSEDPPASLTAISTQSVPEDNQEQINISNQPINHDVSDTTEQKRQMDLPKKKKHKKKKAKNTTHHVEEINPLLPLPKGSIQVPSTSLTDLSSPNDLTEADDNQLAKPTISKHPMNQDDSETIAPQGQNCQTSNKLQPITETINPPALLVTTINPGDSETVDTQGQDCQTSNKLQAVTETINPPALPVKPINLSDSETVKPQGQNSPTLDKPESVQKVIPQKDEDLQKGPEILETIEPQGQNLQTSVPTNDEILESEAKMETEVYTIEQPYIIDEGDFETFETQGQNYQTSAPTSDWILHSGRRKMRPKIHSKTNTIKPPALPVKYTNQGRRFYEPQRRNSQTFAPINDDNQLAKPTISKHPMNQDDSETIAPQGQNCQTSNKLQPITETINPPALLVTTINPGDSETVDTQRQDCQTSNKLQAVTETINPPALPVKPINLSDSETVKPQGQNSPTLDKPESVQKVIPQKDEDLQKGPEILETIEPQGQNLQTSVPTNDKILESEAKMETEVYTIEQPYIIDEGDFETFETQGQNYQTSSPTSDWILHNGRPKMRPKIHSKTNTIKPPALPVKYTNQDRRFYEPQRRNRQTFAPINDWNLHRGANMRLKVHQSRALPMKYMSRGSSKVIEPHRKKYQPVQKGSLPRDRGDKITSEKVHSNIETIKQPAQGQNSQTINEPLPALPVEGSNEMEENSNMVITVGSMPVTIGALPYFNTDAAKAFIKKQWDEAISGDHEVYMSSSSLDNQNNTSFVHPYVDATQAHGRFYIKYTQSNT